MTPHDSRTVYKVSKANVDLHSASSRTTSNALSFKRVITVQFTGN